MLGVACLSTVFVALFLALPGAFAQALPAAEQARVAFDRVDSSPLPARQDTVQCIQAHGALLSQVRADQRYLVHYRSGYCALFGAAVSKNPSDYAEAEKSLNAALEAWPVKRTPVSSGLLALIGVARMGAAPGSVPPEARRVLDTAVEQAECSDTTLMQSSFCTELVDVARLWLGWSAYSANNWTDATRYFGAVSGSTWSLWAVGRQAWAERHWREAAALLERAGEAWAAGENSPTPRVADLLGPKPDLGKLYNEVGLAHYRAENYARAVPAFDLAAARGGNDAYSLFCRARSKQMLGQAPAALLDYGQAITLAANNKDTSWAVGQAHFYQGTLLYAAKRYDEAANSFRSALDSVLGDVRKADVEAWAALVALAAGDCAKAPLALEGAASESSAGFPAADADALAFNCQLSQAGTLEQLLAIEQSSPRKLTSEQARRLHSRISEAYAAQGVAAEDRRDENAAIAAYRKAIEFDPASGKARYNLGSVYFERRNYDLAEEQYRVLAGTEPPDHEAQYFLAEAILRQPLTPARKLEACELVKQSLSIADPQKREQFAKTLSAVDCR